MITEESLDNAVKSRFAIALKIGERNAVRQELYTAQRELEAARVRLKVCQLHHDAIKRRAEALL